MLSFWQKDALSQPTDVAIAGAGFVGLWCAYELKCQYPHLKVTILEKGAFPGGASVRNAGFACFGSPGEMLADTESMGAEAMWDIAHLRYKGIQKLRAVLGDEAIAYDNCGGFECFADDANFNRIARKLDWLNEGMEKLAGVANVFSVADNRLTSLGLQNFQHLIYNHLEGGLHSGKAVQALLQKVASIGVNVVFGVSVESWKSNGAGSVEICADAGEPISLRTTQFLIANNAFTQQLAATFQVQPARGQVLVTSPIEGLQLHGTFHFDEGYYYWRNVGNRILLGGARNSDFGGENTFELATSETIQKALQTFLSRHIPVAKEISIDYTWAGIMAFTNNKQPQILQADENVWAVVACNGMGVALAPSIASKVVQQMFAKNVNAENTLGLTTTFERL